MSSWLKVLGILVISVFSLEGLAQSRLPISISNNVLPVTTLTDYTVRLDINSTNAPGFDFSNNGDDLIAWNFDTTSQLDFYVESVDPVTSTAVIWVRVPSVPTSPPDTQIFLDYNRVDVMTPLSDAASTFVNAGLKYHSQPHVAADPDPATSAAAHSLFDFNTVTSNPNYGCTVLSELVDDHSTIFTQNGDFGLSISGQFIVPADALYEFRLGADFGLGGELTVDGTPLEEDWGNDLWWATNFANVDVLQGDRLLTAGSHTIRALGFERCCDGRAELEYRYDSDGDGLLSDETFQNLTAGSPGLTLLAPSCPVAQVTFGTITTVPVTLAKFQSFKAGPFLKLEWETADETFNVGFNIWTLEGDQDESLRQLNDVLIRSASFDSIDVQSYQWSYYLDRESNLDRVVISSVDINGKQEFFGPFDLGEDYGEDFTPQPIDWQSVHNEFVGKMQARGFRWVNNRWRKKRFVSPDADRVQVGVKTSGVYRVTYEDLLATGVDWSNVKRADIAVSLNGKPIPRAIYAPKKRGNNKSRRLFGPGSAIDFVGIEPSGDLSIYQDERFYQIHIDPNLVQKIRSVRRNSEDPQAWHYERQELNVDNQHVIFSPLQSPWVMDLMFRIAEPVSQVYDFTLPELIEGVEAKVKIELAGIANAPLQDFDNDGALDPHHAITVLVNGQAVATEVFEGQRARNISSSIPAGVLNSGVNQVEVRVEHTGYDFDVVVVDTVALSYPVSNRSTGALRFTDDGRHAQGIVFKPQPRKGLIAYAFRADHNLIRLKPVRAKELGRNQFTVPLVAGGESRYFIGHNSDLLMPSSVAVVNGGLGIFVSDVDLLIVSHPHFIGPDLERYSQERRLQGIENQIISTADIVSQYGSDIPLHEAIQLFLRSTGDSVEYDHVLLVGGHTFDYLNKQNTQSVNFIPTFYRPIGSSRFTPSDQPFIDFDGDGYPEKSIGRWPVRSLDQVKSIVDKSLLWANGETDRGAVGHNVLLLADKKREFDFGSDLDAHFATLKSVNINSAARVYIDQVLQDPLLANASVNEVVQKRVQDEIKNGATWTFYNGHGSPNAWSYSQMLTASKVSDLENEGSPMLITSLGCYTTYYESTTHNSLALQLMFSENNAAMAIHGPSVVGGYENQRELAELIASEMKAGQSVGRAIQLGMKRLPLNYRTAINNWALLGDPSLPVQ